MVVIFVRSLSKIKFTRPKLPEGNAAVPEIVVNALIELPPGSLTILQTGLPLFILMTTDDGTEYTPCLSLDFILIVAEPRFTLPSFSKSHTRTLKF